MREHLVAVRAVGANPQLRRLLLAWMLTSLPVWGGLLAFAVYAYDRGGPAAVGLIAMLRALPGALSAPPLALLVDRVSRRRVMIGCNLARAVAMLAIAAAIAAEAPVGAVYALVVVLAAVSPAYRPALVALLPRASQTPGELASANVVASLVTNAGFLAGSLGVGALLAISRIDLVIALLGFVFILAILPLLAVERDTAPEPEPGESAFGELAAGVREIRRDAGLRPTLLATAAVWFVDGALDVLVVVAALGFLDAGEAGAGALNAVWAAGCMAGGAVMFVVLGRGRLARGVALGAVMIAASTALVAAAPALWAALLGMAMFGVGFTLVEVAVTTLAQRQSPAHVLGRVAGVVEATTVAMTASGALVAGYLAEAVGTQGAIAGAGALVALAILSRAGRLASLEAGAPVPEREYQILRSHEIFVPISVASAERLAHALEEQHAPAGQTVIRQGEDGEYFFLVVSGVLEIFEDGEFKRLCEAGEGFGEIALIRDVPRTATVVAQTDAVLLALDRESFLSTVAGTLPAARAAHRIADSRFAREL